MSEFGKLFRLISKLLIKEIEILKMLLKREINWIWDANHDKCFKGLQAVVSSFP